MAHRVLVVGAGARGRDWMREVRDAPGWDLAGVVETDPASLARVAEEEGAPVGYSSLQEALAAEPSAVAIVATPAEAHLDTATACLEEGRPVLVEKPLAADLASAEQLVARAEAAGLPLVVAQNYRYMRAHSAARRVVDEGRLGRILLVDARYYRPPHEMAPSLAQSEWSVTWGMAVHHFDALRHVLGRDVIEVTAVSNTGDPARSPRGATLQALLAFEGGARATYTATYESSGHQFFEGGQEFYERITGEDATLHMFHRWLVLCPNGRLPRMVRRGPRELSEERALLGEFEKAMQGDPHGCSGRDNLKTMAVVEACMRSSLERRAIDPRGLLA